MTATILSTSSRRKNRRRGQGRWSRVLAQSLRPTPCSVPTTILRPDPVFQERLSRGPRTPPCPGTPRIPAPCTLGYSVASPHQDGPRGVMNESAEITEWLAAARQGDKSALDRVLATLYRELHGMARRQLGGQQQGHTLDTTALVHEAYLKLAGRAEAEFED